MFFILFISLLLNPAHSKRELIARVSDRDGFKIEANCFFSGNQPVLYQSGLLLRVSCYGGEDLYSQLLFISSTAQTKVLVQSSPDHLLSEPVTNGREIYVSEFNAAGTKALYLLNDQGVLNIKMPSHVQMVRGLALSSETLIMRYQDQSGLSQQVLLVNSQWLFQNEKQVSFYFQPAASESLVVQKVRLGSQGELAESQPDEIRLSSDGGLNFKTVLQDQDADSTSAILSFWNFSVVNGNRWVVIARTSQGNVAITGEGSKTQWISLDEFEKIDFFPPAIDGEGRVYLRATLRRVSGLWRVGAKTELILRAGDTLQGERDMLRVRPEIYNAPYLQGQRLFLGVGVEDFNSSTFVGQALVELSIP